MCTLTFYTNQFKDELEEWFLKYNDILMATDFSNEIGYTVTLPYENFDVQSFIDLLEKIILINNPIIKKSTKTYIVIKKFLKKKYGNKIEKDLEEYITTNNEINLDGYMNFRLGEYTHFINMILYSIAKKTFSKNIDM